MHALLHCCLANRDANTVCNTTIVLFLQIRRDSRTRLQHKPDIIHVYLLCYAVRNNCDFFAVLATRKEAMKVRTKRKVIILWRVIWLWIGCHRPGCVQVTRQYEVNSRYNRKNFHFNDRKLSSYFHLPDQLHFHPSPLQETECWQLSLKSRGWDYVSELGPSTNQLYFIPQMIWVWRATVEWYWQGEIRRIRRKLVPVPFCPSQIPHGLIRLRTRDSAVRRRRLTAWAIARPCWQFLYVMQINLLNISYYILNFLELLRDY
jgi:hypothetical protein